MDNTAGLSLYGSILSGVSVENIQKGLGRVGSLENNKIQEVALAFKDQSANSIDVPALKNDIATYIDLRKPPTEITSPNRLAIFKIAAIVCVAVVAVFALTFTPAAAAVSFLLGAGVAASVIAGLLTGSLGAAVLGSILVKTLGLKLDLKNDAINQQTTEKTTKLEKKIESNLKELYALVSDQKKIELLGKMVTITESDISKLRHAASTSANKQMLQYLNKIELEEARLAKLTNIQKTFTDIKEALDKLEQNADGGFIIKENSNITSRLYGLIKLEDFTFDITTQNVQLVESQLDRSAGTNPNIAMLTARQLDLNANNPNVVMTENQLDLNANKTNVVMTENQLDLNANKTNVRVIENR